MHFNPGLIPSKAKQSKNKQKKCQKDIFPFIAMVYFPLNQFPLEVINTVGFT